MGALPKRQLLTPCSDSPPAAALSKQEFWQPNNNAFGVQQPCTKASSAGNPIIFGCPLYGVQKAPPGATIFQANANGVFVANSAINWGGNGINAQSLHMNGASGNSVNAYIFFCGLLMSQWCYTGYDASAHMSEETKDADRAGPFGIISTIVVTFAFGLAYSAFMPRRPGCSPPLTDPSPARALCPQSSASL